MTLVQSNLTYFPDKGIRSWISKMACNLISHGVGQHHKIGRSLKIHELERPPFTFPYEVDYGIEAREIRYGLTDEKYVGTERVGNNYIYLIGQRDFEPIVVEDNQATTTIIEPGKSPAFRHCDKTQRLNLGWLAEQFRRRHFKLVYGPAQMQAADILTKPFTSAEKWSHAISLFSIRAGDFLPFARLWRKENFALLQLRPGPRTEWYLKCVVHQSLNLETEPGGLLEVVRSLDALRIGTSLSKKTVLQFALRSLVLFVTRQWAHMSIVNLDQYSLRWWFYMFLCESTTRNRSWESSSAQIGI